MLNPRHLVYFAQDQMVNRGSTAAAEELEGLSKKELLSMLKFGADRWEAEVQNVCAVTGRVSMCCFWSWYHYISAHDSQRQRTFGIRDCQVKHCALSARRKA